MHKIPHTVGADITILLFGHTGAGKTALIGELAEFYFKKDKRRTRLYTADRGGFDTISPYVELGIIDAIPMFGDPWLWINHAVKGDKLENGLWVPGVGDGIALWAYEGMTSFADAVMLWMSEASSRGVNIGGGGAFSFNVTDGKESTKIGSNNMAHYSVAQQQVYQKSTQSQQLPGTVLWTAGDRRGEDDAIGGVIGPQIAGKAMTGEAPRWFKYTFRVATEMSGPGVPPRHVLYLEDHMEPSARMAKGIANSRVPLAGTKVAVPSRIEPASLVDALHVISQRKAAAKDEIRARLGL
jgi:hypothetical protein